MKMLLEQSDLKRIIEARRSELEGIEINLENPSKELLERLNLKIECGFERIEK